MFLTTRHALTSDFTRTIVRDLTAADRRMRHLQFFSSAFFCLARPFPTPYPSVPTFHAKQVFPHLPFFYFAGRIPRFQEYARNAPSLRDWQLQLRFFESRIENPGARSVIRQQRGSLLPAPIGRSWLPRYPSHNRTACDYNLPCSFVQGWGMRRSLFPAVVIMVWLAGLNVFLGVV
jgi:hypothetical protein